MSPREQLFDELDHLATVEHALCVEYLLLDCALVDRGPGFNLALTAMFQLRMLNDALVAAGQAGDLARATEVRGTPPTVFAPLVAGQLDGILDREYAIAVAVDARYAIAGSLLGYVPDLEPELRDLIIRAVDAGVGHAAAVTSLREKLSPTDYLRPVREPAGDVEETLQSVSLREYRLIVRLLEEHFAGSEELTMLVLAKDAMTTLQGILFLLTERNLLPLFD
jgi:hypothetical protein